MSDKLKVAFDDPEHGWVGLSLTWGSETVVIIASYTPSDSFLDLVNALYHLFLYEGEAQVAWNAEPTEYEFRFDRKGSAVSLEVLKYSDSRRELGLAEQCFSASGSYEDIGVPFWRALRNLCGRFSAEELNARWHRPFPWKEIESLTSQLGNAR